MWILHTGINHWAWMLHIGQARFVGPDTVSVEGAGRQPDLGLRQGGCVYRGAAAAPPIPGLEEAGYLTNETVFSLTALPARVGVIGAGLIGCELAQALADSAAEYRSLRRCTASRMRIETRRNASNSR